MWFKLILIIANISSILSATPDNTQYHCFKSQKPRTNATIPLAEEFSAYMLADSPLWQIEWEILTNQLQNNAENVSTVERTNMDGTVTSWYMNYTNETGTTDFSNGTMKQMNMSGPEWALENPFNVSNEFLSSHEAPPKSFLELIQWVQHDFRYIWKIEKFDGGSDPGMTGDHYVSCKENSQPSKTDVKLQRHWIEVEIVYPRVNPNDKLHKTDVPISIELKAYKTWGLGWVIVDDYVRFNFYHVQNATKPTINPDTTNRGYSATFLVGVGAGMAVVGIIIGIIVGYFISKFVRGPRDEVAYQNQQDETQ